MVDESPALSPPSIETEDQVNKFFQNYTEEPKFGLFDISLIIFVILFIFIFILVLIRVLIMPSADKIISGDGTIADTNHISNTNIRLSTLPDISFGSVKDGDTLVYNAALEK